MKRYMIEREIPEVRSMGTEQLAGAAQTSNEALDRLAPHVQWLESFVAADKTFCVYLARDEDVIREHARLSGFPASRITPVHTVIDPTTANCG